MPGSGTALLFCFFLHSVCCFEKAFHWKTWTLKFDCNFTSLCSFPFQGFTAILMFACFVPFSFWAFVIPKFVFELRWILILSKIGFCLFHAFVANNFLPWRWNLLSISTQLWSFQIGFSTLEIDFWAKHHDEITKINSPIDRREMNLIVRMFSIYFHHDLYKMLVMFPRDHYLASSLVLFI